MDPGDKGELSPLLRFLADHDLTALADHLANDTLESLVHELFEDGGRPALLNRLVARGLRLKERQALANALNRANRLGYPGVTESMDQVSNRTAWLDGDGEISSWRSCGSPFLVFTSAGDRGNVPMWAQGDRDFELCVVYYGDADEPRHARATDGS